jgi:hypothetical protein
MDGANGKISKTKRELHEGISARIGLGATDIHQRTISYVLLDGGVKQEIIGLMLNLYNE